VDSGRKPSLHGLLEKPLLRPSSLAAPQHPRVCDSAEAVRALAQFQRHERKLLPAQEGGGGKKAPKPKDSGEDASACVRLSLPAASHRSRAWGFRQRALERLTGGAHARRQAGALLSSLVLSEGQAGEVMPTPREAGEPELNLTPRTLMRRMLFPDMGAAAAAVLQVRLCTRLSTPRGVGGDDRFRTKARLWLGTACSGGLKPEPHSGFCLGMNLFRNATDAAASSEAPGERRRQEKRQKRGESEAQEGRRGGPTAAHRHRHLLDRRVDQGAHENATLCCQIMKVPERRY
jgi:hypothetical protein